MAQTIVMVMPVWARMAEMTALTGLPDNVVRRLANEGKVRARKSGETENAACLFRIQDALDWIEEEAPKAPEFRLPAGK